MERLRGNVFEATFHVLYAVKTLKTKTFIIQKKNNSLNLLAADWYGND